MDLLDIALSTMSFLTLREKISLKNNIDNLDSLAVLSIEELSQRVGRRVRTFGWNGHDAMVYAKKSACVMENQQISGSIYTDHDYPALLKEIPDAPYAVFYRGNISILESPTVSVAGTRRVSEVSAVAAFEFAYKAVKDGLVVVSGFANGIDTFAHRGALEASRETGKGGTAVVLPCGIDSVVPSSNRLLAEQILRNGGCILSEYAPGCASEKWRFVQRNRIIAALSPATVIIHAPEGSGALITADFAVDYSRDLMIHRASLDATVNETETPDVEGRRKAKRSVKHFLNDGAPVIGSYEEYKSVFSSAPGIQKSQPELF